jgi:hypothetical protein
LDNATLGLIAQFGFPAVMLYLVWTQYTRVQPTLMEVLGQNAAAMQAMARALDTNTQSLERLTTCMTGVQERLGRLEEQHKMEGVR